MLLKERISRVKKPLPNLNGRAILLPPLNSSDMHNSKRSFSMKPRKEGRTKDNTPLGLGNENEFNHASASQIPINSMYEGEEERKAAIPPPLGYNSEHAPEKVP